MHSLKLFLLIGMSITTFVLGACTNTLNGVGRDVENTGEYIQDVFH